MPACCGYCLLCGPALLLFLTIDPRSGCGESDEDSKDRVCNPGDDVGWCRHLDYEND